MKRLTNLLAITLLTSCVTAFAQEQEETTTEKSAVEQSADIYAAGYNKFRFGGPYYQSYTYLLSGMVPL